MQDLEAFPLIRLQECLYFIPRNAGHFVGDRTKSLLDIRQMGPLHDVLHLLKIVSSSSGIEHENLIRSIVRQLNVFCHKQLGQMEELGLQADPQYEKLYIRTHVVYRMGSTWTISQAEIERYMSNASGPIPEGGRYTLADYLDEDQELRLMLLSENHWFELSLPWLHIAYFLEKVIRLDTCVKDLEQVPKRGRMKST